MMANIKVMIQKMPVRVFKNSDKVGQVPSWEGSIVAVNERQSGPPAIAGRRMGRWVPSGASGTSYQ
jgi:hypothetical protein